MLSKPRVGLFIYYSTHTILCGKYHFCLYFKIFLMWTIFKVIEFGTILLLFYFLTMWHVVS